MSPELFDNILFPKNQSKELDIFVDFRDYTYQFFKLVMLSDDKFLREGPEPFPTNCHQILLSCEIIYSIVLWAINLNTIYLKINNISGIVECFLCKMLQPF